MPIMPQRIESCEMRREDAETLKLGDAITTSWNGGESEGIISGLALDVKRNTVKVTVYYAD